jgi:hypothetical protein
MALSLCEHGLKKHCHHKVQSGGSIVFAAAGKSVEPKCKLCQLNNILIKYNHLQIGLHSAGAGTMESPNPAVNIAITRLPRRPSDGTPRNDNYSIFSQQKCRLKIHKLLILNYN